MVDKTKQPQPTQKATGILDNMGRNLNSKESMEVVATA
jgi:hypothetical protein